MKKWQHQHRHGANRRIWRAPMLAPAVKARAAGAEIKPDNAQRRPCQIIAGIGMAARPVKKWRARPIGMLSTQCCRVW